MVIANSDSTSTLVSLDHHHDALRLKRVSSLEALTAAVVVKEEAFRPTRLYLPEEVLGVDDFDDELDCMNNEDDDEYDERYNNDDLRVPIYLTAAATTTTCDNTSHNNKKHYSFGADECLRCLPSIVEAGDRLLAAPVVQYNAETCKTTRRQKEERLLYVLQGEMAHAVAPQCDVVVSDRATTCHILAVRSTCYGCRRRADACCSSSSCSPLVSLTHLDAPHCYDDCLREMMRHHEKHHQHNHCCNNSTNANTMIQMDIHIVGGFEDSKGSSRDISNWLLHLLADLADEFADRITMTLQHCLITCMNHDDQNSQSGAPLARGLAIHIASGRVYLAKCSANCGDHNAMGPAIPLRSARLWCGSSMSPRRLALVHTTTTTPCRNENAISIVQIEPFQLRSFSGLPTLLALPDYLLLQYCSTSPDCEEDDFCASLRQTLRFIQTATSANARNNSNQTVFGNDNKDHQPMLFQRQGGNTWQRVIRKHHYY